MFGLLKKYKYKIFTVIFVLTIVSGFVYGIYNEGYYKKFGDIFKEECDMFCIFSNNFKTGIYGFFTLGSVELIGIFNAFAFISSILIENNAFIILLPTLIHGIPEMLGFLYFGFASIALVSMEWNRMGKLLLVAGILLFVASFLEFYISTPVAEFMVALFR